MYYYVLMYYFLSTKGHTSEISRLRREKHDKSRILLPTVVEESWERTGQWSGGGIRRGRNTNGGSLYLQRQGKG